MAISQTLKACLDNAKVSYTAMTHPTAYTAQEIAAAQHIKGRSVAKCVLLITDRGPFLTVLPAIQLVDFKRVKAFVGAKRVRLASEAEIRQQFPDVEVGAMSPFGNLYHIPVIAEKTLDASQHIVFNAGSHTDTIKLRHQDFLKLVRPRVGAFGHALATPSKSARRGKTSSARRKRATPTAPGRSKSRRPQRSTPGTPRSSASRSRRRR